MKIKSEVKFVNDSVKETFLKLKEGDESEKQLFKYINQALENIKEDAFCGIQIPKRLIPKEYILKYGVKNIWKYNLPGVWRLVYSLVNERAVVVSIVLEWFNHKEYERRFNYLF